MTPDQVPKPTCEEPGSKVSGRVESVAAVEAEADPDPDDGEADEQWDQLLADLKIKYKIKDHDRKGNEEKEQQQIILKIVQS
jgi:hypothetical protein